jgi:sugar O-acyltransferase (sialic acid O-acetyltransferase NeuD family)
MDNVLIVGNGGLGRTVKDILEINFAGRKVYFKEIKIESSKIKDADNLTVFIKKKKINRYTIAIGDNYTRMRITELMRSVYPGLRLISVIHESANISKDAIIHPGSIILAGVTINSQAELKSGVLVCSNSCIDHDCFLGEFSSTGPGVNMGGDSFVGKKSHIGVGSCMIHNGYVGDDVIIGAGSTVIGLIKQATVAYGTPARSVRNRIIREKYL